MLNCSRRNAPSPLRLACCARGRVMFYCSRGRPPNPLSLLRSASPLRLALLCVRRRSVCIVFGVDPRALSLFFFSLSLCYLHTFQHCAISMRRRNMSPYSKKHRRATLRASGAWRAAASRCCFGGLSLRRRPLALGLLNAQR